MSRTCVCSIYSFQVPKGQNVIPKKKKSSKRPKRIGLSRLEKPWRKTSAAANAAGLLPSPSAAVFHFCSSSRRQRLRPPHALADPPIPPQPLSRRRAPQPPAAGPWSAPPGRRAPPRRRREGERQRQRERGQGQGQGQGWGQGW